VWDIFSTLEEGSMLACQKKHSEKNLHHRIPALCVIACLGIGWILAGCSPTATPTIQVEPPEETQQPEEGGSTDGSLPSIIRLPDGSEISLEPDSYLEIIKVSDVSSGDSGHEVLLHRGTIEVNSQLPEGSWFTVFDRNYYFARVTGSVMVIYYDPVTGKFMMSCVEGLCEFGQDGQTALALGTNQQGCIDADGHFIGPFDNVDFDELSELCVFEEPQETEPPEATDTGTPTPSQTPDSEGTATAACIDFESQFPGTPCP
jgi:hypothetical protein